MAKKRGDKTRHDFGTVKEQVNENEKKIIITAFASEDDNNECPASFRVSIARKGRVGLGILMTKEGQEDGNRVSISILSCMQKERLLPSSSSSCFA